MMKALALSLFLHAALLSLPLQPPPSSIPKTAFSDHAIVVRTHRRIEPPRPRRIQKRHAFKTPAGNAGSKKATAHRTPVLRPEYPVISRRLGHEGKVVIKAMIDTDGIVLAASIIHSSGFVPLDRAALRVVKNARFSVPRATEREFSFKFELQ